MTQVTCQQEIRVTARRRSEGIGRSRAGNSGLDPIRPRVPARRSLYWASPPAGAVPSITPKILRKMPGAIPESGLTVSVGLLAGPVMR